MSAGMQRDDTEDVRYGKAQAHWRGGIDHLFSSSTGVKRLSVWFVAAVVFSHLPGVTLASRPIWMC